MHIKILIYVRNKRKFLTLLKNACILRHVKYNQKVWEYNYIYIESGILKSRRLFQIAIQFIFILYSRGEHYDCIVLGVRNYKQHIKFSFMILKDYFIVLSTILNTFGRVSSRHNRYLDEALAKSKYWLCLLGTSLMNSVLYWTLWNDLFISHIKCYAFSIINK